MSLKRLTTKEAMALPIVREPSITEIESYIQIHPSHSFYTAREALRNIAYGGLPPRPYKSWGDFNKSI